jgi:glycosyltransferase involved in cell wall biosynthesis
MEPSRTDFAERGNETANILSRLSGIVSSVKKDSVIYIVVGEGVNHRVEKILSLRSMVGNMVLSRNGNAESGDGELAISAYPNPLGVFRSLNLNRWSEVLERYAYFPSRDMLYVWKARGAFEQHISRDLAEGRKVCLLTCVPPHDISLLGLHFKRRFPQIYWVVDWQDLWSYDEYYFLRTPPIYRERLLKLEKTIFDTCDVNVTTNDRAKTLLEDLYGIPSKRVASIPHHFCREELDGLSEIVGAPVPREHNEVVRLGFLGNLFKLPKMPGGRVVEAVAHAVKTGLNVQLHVFGDQSDQMMEASRALKGTVFAYKPTRHEESLKHIASCDFLLLAMSELPNCRVVMNIKLPHYLMLGKPIVAMVPQESAVADIIRETRTGYVIPSISDWRTQLKQVLEDHLSGRSSLRRNEPAVEQFSWKCIREQWLSVLDEGNVNGKGR